MDLMWYIWRLFFLLLFLPPECSFTRCQRDFIESRKMRISQNFLYQEKVVLTHLYHHLICTTFWNSNINHSLYIHLSYPSVMNLCIYLRLEPCTIYRNDITDSAPVEVLGINAILNSKIRLWGRRDNQKEDWLRPPRKGWDRKGLSKNDRGLNESLNKTQWD